MSQPLLKTPSPMPESGRDSSIEVSVVVPLLNEEASLPELIARIGKALDTTGRSYELVLVNDGSTDRSLSVLTDAAGLDSHIRVVDLVRNAGQHAAVLAGFANSRGDIVVTLDADLQNPPEEIPRLIDAVDDGFDVVGTVRENRQDSTFRRLASRLLNLWTRRVAGVHLHDYGSMLRAYHRRVIDKILATPEVSSFIPVLAERYSARATEIKVAHDERQHGKSRYNFFKLLWLQFDLTTSFSLVPLRLTLICGLLLAGLSFAVALGLLVGRVVMGSEWAVSGVFTVLAFIVMLIGAVLFGLGLVGEYIGRIYLEVRHRPSYLIRDVFGGDALQVARPVERTSSAGKDEAYD
jgi:undecaprenyl-phosphate 4-deoxy-4-formamido-L-arabinose transferase